MNRTWFSYVILSVGLMLLVASDKEATADEKKTAHTISYGSEQQIEIFVNKDGEDNAEVKLMIDGEEFQFSMPEIADGENKVITTSDGKEVTIKSVSGNKMIWIDGKELNLPNLGKHHIAAEGLSAMIGKTHQMQVSNEVTIRANGLSDDVQNAIIDAVKGVLTSYDVDKKVSFNNNDLQLHFLTKDNMGSMMHKIDRDSANYKIIIDSEHADNEDNVMIIKKKVEVIEEN
ncbi:MAG: hypothetical protein GY829_01965 [Gammaproteobacteria bacterium]|nr:hypothetical protein [Gammaproteobacteria bacterium]